jgi:Ca2+-binding RTX toxin-like protein
MTTRPTLPTATHRGTAGNDTVTGTAGNNVIDGLAGADTMRGGSGNDIYVVDHADDRVVESANGGIDTVFTALDHTLAENVEILVGTGAAGLTLKGNNADNTIFGTDRADTIEGGWGRDTLVGGRGDDTLDGGLSFDVAVYSGRRSDYTIYQLNGETFIRDLRTDPAVNEGTDRLIGIETVRFADGEFLAHPISTPNRAPSAAADRVTTANNTAVTVDVLANDSDIDAIPGLSLRVTKVGSAANGTATLDAQNRIVYTPKAGWSGVETIDYTIDDGRGGVATGKLTVTVEAPVNTAPVAVIDRVSTNEDTVLTFNPVANDTDAEGDRLTLQAVGSAQNGTVSLLNGQAVYTPRANWNGTDSFTYTVSDGNGGTTLGQAVVTVAPVNDLPSAVSDTASTLGTTPVTINVLANDSDIDGDTLALRSVTQGANGSVAITNGQVTYTPRPNFSGADSFTYTVHDGKGGERTGQVTVNVAPAPQQNAPADNLGGSPMGDAGGVPTGGVTPVANAGNAVPTARPDTASVAEDGSVTVNVLANDSDANNDPLSIAGFSQGANGSVALANNRLVYTPKADWNGTDRFTYTVSDGKGGFSVSQVAVTVTPVNDAPITANDSATVSAGGTVTIDALANDRDKEGDSLTLSGVTQGQKGAVTIAAGQLSYRANANASGTDSFTYTVSDGKGGTSTARVDISIGSANKAPVAQNDTATTSMNTPIGIRVLANDMDPEGAAMMVVDVGAAVHGLAEIINNGAEVRYTPFANFIGNDSFVYTVRDAAGLTQQATVSVNVAAAVAATPSPLAIPSLSAPQATITGTTGNNALTGTNGADVIDGGAGTDTMTGGAGDDIYIVDRTNDVVVEAANGGTDTVYTRASYTLPAHVENLIHTSTNWNFTFTGNELDNVIADHRSGNTLRGMGGNDTLSARAGGRLEGGDGTDTAVFAGNYSDYIFAAVDGPTGREIVVEATNTRHTLSSIEVLQFADRTLTLDEALAGQMNSAAVAAGGRINNAPIAPQSAGDIVGVKLTNTGFGAESAKLVTWGQAFKPGDLRPGEGLVAIVNGQAQAVQVDVKALNADGSVRHAVLTTQSPALSEGGSADAMLRKGSPTAGSPISVQSVLQNGYDVDVNLSLANADGSRTAISIDVGSVLQQTLAQGKVATWMSGPLASEFRVEHAINANLAATFDIRAYADGTVRTDVILKNSEASGTQARTFTYDVEILQNGERQFADNVVHIPATTWREQLWRGDKPDVHVAQDVNYLAASGAIAAFDSTAGSSASGIRNSAISIANSDLSPMGDGPVEDYMPGPGGRGDLGLLPSWYSNYLSSQDPTAFKAMIDAADQAGSVPWHLTFGGRYQDPLQTAPSMDASFSSRDMGGWTLDLAHKPALSYVPYLFTGDQYYLDNLRAEASYVTTVSKFAGTPGTASAGVFDLSEIRGRAWGLRDLSDAAFILPDADPLKSSLSTVVQRNAELYTTKYAGDADPFAAGETAGSIRDGASNIPMFQNDFLQMVLGTMHQRGQGDLSAYMEWSSNFIAGRFLNSDLGFSPLLSDDGWISGRLSGGASIADWAVLGQNAISQGGRDRLNSQGDTQGYMAHARGALAANFSVTHSPEAAEAYGFAVASDPNLNVGGGANFAVIPEMPDGSFLTQANTRVGTANADSLSGTSGSDFLHGGAGNDTIDGGAGQDLVYGGEGNDTVRGGLGDDYVFGNEGDDQLFGGDGNDYLVGGAGIDTLRGEAGNDFLLYDPQDTIDGGTGIDTIYLNDWRERAIDLADTKILNVERIDLSNRTNDTLKLSAADIVRVSDNDQLWVRGDSVDAISGAGFTRVGTVTDQGVQFAHFTGGGASLYIQTGLQFNGASLI